MAIPAELPFIRDAVLAEQVARAWMTLAEDVPQPVDAQREYDRKEDP